MTGLGRNCDRSKPRATYPGRLSPRKNHPSALRIDRRRYRVATRSQPQGCDQNRPLSEDGQTLMYDAAFRDGDLPGKVEVLCGGLLAGEYLTILDRSDPWRCA